MTTLVDETFGKYEISRLLGKGGMGEVYEAYDTDKGRRVALKLLPDQYADDETFRARFLRESRAAAILQEPHVIPIHDWGEIDHRLYIDMRLVNGQTLHDMLKTGPLEPERAADIIRQIASALDAAHAQGLIHRDVKPQNIIVTADDFAYLVDFGIAQAKGDTNLTMAGYQVGSWHYMAPERLRDEEVTPAVDIYSLACVLYEALTGRKPFPGNTEQTMTAHLSAPPPRPSAVNPRVPAAFDDVVARGMAKHPDDRYGSAAALGRAAKRALSADSSSSAGTQTRSAPQHGGAPYDAQYGSPPTVPGPIVGHHEDSRRFLLPSLIAVTAVLLIVVVVLVVIGFGNRNSDSDNPSPTTTYSTPALPTYQSTPPTETSTITQTLRVPTTVTSAPATLDAEQQLRQIVSGDRSFVTAQLAGHWVPQLSAKRPGTQDGGLTWDNAMALQEHLQLRQAYGASLLWSGEWSTFSASDYWVTVVNLTFSDSSGPLAWCRNRGFDRDHCIAKFISKTHPVAGSTAYN